VHDSPGTASDGRDRGSPILSALPFAALTVALDGRVEGSNTAASEVLDVDLAEGPLLSSLFVEGERGAADEVLGQALHGSGWQGVLAIVAPDGAARPVTVSCEPVWERDAVGRVLVVLEDVDRSRARARRLADRMSRLARVITELLSAEDVEGVTTVFTGHVADAAGATVASLSLLVEEDRLRLVGIRGGRDGVADRWRTFSLAGTPAGDAVIAGRAVVLSGRDEITSRYPTLERAAEGERSILCIPLMVSGQPIGAVSLSFPGVRRFGAAELEFLQVMSDTCAQALDRARALAAARDQEAKLAFLADASLELSSGLDYESTLAKVAQLAVPGFADWCSIALGVDGELRPLAVAHVDPDKVALAREFQRRFPADPEAGQGGYDVFRTGVTQLVSEISDEMLEAAVEDPEELSIMRELNVRSAMTVALKVNDRVLGVITWVAGDTGRRFTVADVAFGEDLARRAAVAIDNSRLHTEVREMAVNLQRAVLPAELPSLPGWEMAAHYSPTGDLDAGGDFYDVIDLGDGCLALFVGDVMGRGVHAAAAMAQMRSATRALVAVDPEPAAVLTRLDRVFERYDLEQLVTMFYAVVDPSADTLVVANAGHLSPVLIRPDAEPTSLSVPGEVLLGAGGGRRTAVTFPFRPQDTLLAFTDGLVERRHEDIDVGEARLRDAARGLAGGPLEPALTDLVKTVCDPDRDDDVAVLVVRRS